MHDLKDKKNWKTDVIYQIAKTKTCLDDALHKVLLRERVSTADRLLQQTRQHHLAMGVVNTNELLCGKLKKQPNV